MTLQLKPNEWLGIALAVRDSAGRIVTVSDKVARVYGAARLGCKREQIELKRTGGVILVRKKRKDNDNVTPQTT